MNPIDGQVFIAQGDITRIHADAVVVTRGVAFAPASTLFAAFATHANPPGGVSTDGGFAQRYQEALTAHRARRSSIPPSTPSHAFFVPCSESSKPHGVVFVSIPLDDKASESKAFHQPIRDAIEAAVDGLRKLHHDGHLLIALVAFGLGLGGGRQDRINFSRSLVGAAYDAIGSGGISGVDVAFILSDPITYGIFLEARRQEIQTRKIERPDFPLSQDKIASLLEALQSGECALFVGSGLSSGSGLVSYGHLISDMADQLGVTKPSPEDLDGYLDLAQWYRDKFPGRVQETITKHYGADPSGVAAHHPSLAHYLLLSLPQLRYIFTTNYDNLLEDTLGALRKYPVRVTSADKVAQTGFRDGIYVTKIHGDAQDPGNVVLSRDDYDNFFRDRPEMAALLEGLLLNQTFLFVGYGLRDPNFRQISSKISLILQKSQRPAYVTSMESSNAILRNRYERDRIHLLEFAQEDAGPTSSNQTQEKVRRLLCFLDRLAEEVMETDRVFLAPDADHPATLPEHPLHTLHTSMKALGKETVTGIKQLSKGKAVHQSREHLRVLSSTLAFLAEKGWHPSGTSVTQLWCDLADAWARSGGSTREHRQMLASALHYANNIGVAQRLRQELANLTD